MIIHNMHFCEEIKNKIFFFFVQEKKKMSKHLISSYGIDRVITLASDKALFSTENY